MTRIALAILLTLTLTALCHAQEPAEKPPSITYSDSHTSHGWIDTPSGIRVAVHRGVTWKGVTIYPSLTFDLVGVDAKTNKAIWARNEGAFWGRVTFRQVKPKGATRLRWAVELAPPDRNDPTRRFLDLRTGKRLVIPGMVNSPAGRAVKPRKVWFGSGSNVAKPLTARVTSARQLAALRKRLFGGLKVEHAGLGKVDFDKEVVIVISDGDGTNCNGISAAGAWVNKERVLLRLRHHTYQTAYIFDDGRDRVQLRERPYGIFVLPRQPEARYVVERNAQRFISGPPIWKPVTTFQAVPAIRVEKR